MMEQKRLLRVVGYGLLATSALTMAYYIRYMFVGGVNSVRPMLICIALICAPLALGTFLVVRALPDVAEKKLFVRRILWALFAFYLAALVAVLFVARIEPAEYAAARTFYFDNIPLMTNFIPFETIRLYIRCLIYDFIGIGIPFDNLIGNVLLFMPMSLFLPCLFPSMRRFWRFLILMTALLVAVEALQFVLCCGSCDVDDVILNLAGTVLVYFLLRLPILHRLLVRLYLYPEDTAPISVAASDETGSVAPSKQP